MKSNPIRLISPFWCVRMPVGNQQEAISVHRAFSAYITTVHWVHRCGQASYNPYHREHLSQPACTKSELLSPINWPTSHVLLLYLVQRCRGLIWASSTLPFADRHSFYRFSGETGPGIPSYTWSWTLNATSSKRLTDRPCSGLSRCRTIRPRFSVCDLPVFRRRIPTTHEPRFPRLPKTGNATGFTPVTTLLSFSFP